MGIGHSVIAKNMRLMRNNLKVLSETPDVIAELERLISTVTPPVMGKAVYDCNIVATMLHYGIDTILTHNVKDFTPRYDGMITVMPLI